MWRFGEANNYEFYYCLISDSAASTLMLPVTLKNVLKELSAVSDGICPSGWMACGTSPFSRERVGSGRWALGAGHWAQD